MLGKVGKRSKDTVMDPYDMKKKEKMWKKSSFKYAGHFTAAPTSSDDAVLLQIK
jgi:hypothetical protein